MSKTPTKLRYCQELYPYEQCACEKKKEKQSKEKIKKLRTKQSMYEIENLRYQGLVGSE